MNPEVIWKILNRGEEMKYKAEYIALLKKALAAETETVRLYTAMMAIAAGLQPGKAAGGQCG